MRREKFKELFLPFHAKLYRIAYRMFGNEDDAKDIVQELYLKLWSGKSDWERVSNPEAFSVTLLKNLCLDQLRSKKTVFVRETTELIAEDEHNVLPEEDFNDEADLVKLLILKLPKQQQKVILLRDVEECSLEDIAEITGLSAVNVRVLLSRARREIREQFKQLRKL